jgi:hypothetical protein
MTDQPALSNGGNSMEKCFRSAAAIETLMVIARVLASPSDIQATLEQIMIQVSRLYEVKASGRNGVHVAGCCCPDAGQIG